uniref:Uncharacterized protein n=1 Tax=Rhizophora mucronata TaxID=61149 RepID=A0A2P2P137_RHIMU
MNYVIICKCCFNKIGYIRVLSGAHCTEKN